MSQRILIVDDTFETRKLTKDRLEENGYEVLTAVDGVDALKVLKDNAQIDLVITDYRMPALGGEDLIELLKHHYPDLRKIVISGYPFVKEKIPADIPMIPKPIDWNQALSLIQKTLQK